MVYPCILWIQVFIILFHRNSPELPFNRWIFGNLLSGRRSNLWVWQDPPIYPSPCLPPGPPCQICQFPFDFVDNLWIIMNYPWLRMLCKVLLAVLRRTCKIFRTDSALHILTATNLLTRQKDRWSKTGDKRRLVHQGQKWTWYNMIKGNSISNPMSPRIITISRCNFSAWAISDPWVPLHTRPELKRVRSRRRVQAGFNPYRSFHVWVLLSSFMFF